MKPRPVLSRFRNGFSLIELLLVLGVIAILLVAAFVIYPQVVLSHQVSTETNNIAQMKANMRAMFASRNYNYGASLPTRTNTLMLNRARVFPSNMNRGDYSATTVNHIWGGEVLIYATSGPHNGVATGRGFVMVYYDVPSKACVDLVVRTLPHIRAVQVTYGTSNTPSMLPETYQISDVVERCGTGATRNIIFITD